MIRYHLIFLSLSSVTLSDDSAGYTKNINLVIVLSHRRTTRMKTRVKRGRLMIIAGIFLLLVTGIFRIQTDITWSWVVTASYLLGLSLILIGLALAYKGA